MKTLSAFVPFTPTEEKVLALVVEGLTNREIASRLIVSKRTIESHVANMLIKSGTANRTELTKFHFFRNRFDQVEQNKLIETLEVLTEENNRLKARIDKLLSIARDARRLSSELFDLAGFAASVKEEFISKN